MKTQELKVIDRTAGDADTVSGTVIIHDTVGGEPSIIAYNADIEFALEEIAGTLPEGYEYLPEECANAWKTRADWLTMEGLKDALGVRIEHFEDFLKETDWIYPDDLMNKNTEQEEPHRLEEILKSDIAANNKAGIMGLFVGLHEAGKQEDIEYLVSLHPENEMVSKIARAVFNYEPDHT